MDHYRPEIASSCQSVKQGRYIWRQEEERAQTSRQIDTHTDTDAQTQRDRYTQRQTDGETQRDTAVQKKHRDTDTHKDKLDHLFCDVVLESYLTIIYFH